MKRVGKYILLIVGIMALLAVFLEFMLGDYFRKDEVNKKYALEKENTLVIYTSHKEEVYAPIIKEFEERTGIWVQVVTGGTNELLERIAKENAEPSGDVMFGGGVDSLDAYSDYFMSYKANQYEMLETVYQDKEDKWTAFSKLPIVFIYNNKLVYSAGTPRSWEELLNHKWQGKIAFADPGNSGTSYTALTSMIQIIDKDNEEKIINEFRDNLNQDILLNSGAVLDEVISGNKLVGITLEEAALKKIAAGADIGMVYPYEGTTAVPDGTAIINNAVHKENAELFLDFTVSEDVQCYITEQCYRRSIRKDRKDADTIDEVSYDLEWASREQNHILEYWNGDVQ